MGTRGVSKFTSLLKLLDIKKDYYRGKDGRDYDQHEVDQMIIQKTMKQVEQKLDDTLREMDELDQYMHDNGLTDEKQLLNNN